ncbi:hypothetical protein OROMI_020379 [Orobanche minor]
MGLSDSGSLSSASYDDVQGVKEHNQLASVNEDIETDCWGCGLRVLVSPCASVFKCGWCGAITKQNVVKSDDIRFRRLRDRCFVCIVLSFMLIIICTGIWIGNCVGAANHRSFVLFLISTVISTLYVAIMTSYASFHIWPPLDRKPVSNFSGFINSELMFRVVKEHVLSFLRSAVFLPIRGLVLVYLFIASVSVCIGLGVLLWQQLSYIYAGKTYLSHLSAVDNGEVTERDCQNLVRFFRCPYNATAYLPSYWKSRKMHNK